jgi:transposase
LGIPTLYDRACQAVAKAALEPQWEAKFEANSYGFRPGRSAHDAIEAIFNTFRVQSKYVLDADIKGCLEALATDLKERGKLDLSECFIDGTFIVAKKGEDAWVRPSGARVRSSWQWQTALVFLSPYVPPQLRLTRVDSSPLPSTPASSLTFPRRLIGDRAYDADPLDEELAKLGVEMIAPHRRNRKKPKTQDGRPLRRYKRRWKIERLFAWLGNFRRLVVWYERHALNYLGFVQLGCILILLRQGVRDQA